MITLLNKLDITKDTFYKNQQGNILKGHGRDFTSNIFLRFDSQKKDETMAWLSKFSEKLTSCKKQLHDNEMYKRNKVNGGVFYGFLISAKGYQYLGKDISAFGDSFKKGMKHQDIQQKLQDPDVLQWEEPFTNEIHAMVLIGDDDESILANVTRDLILKLKAFADIITIEFGNAIRNANGDGLEHFGYVDGISQPVFFEDELQGYKSQNNGNDAFDPATDFSQVLVKDPLAQEDDAYGSYFVFRKLEQNVRGFKMSEEALGESLKLEGEDKERAGAMLVGRFEDGTPVTVHDEEGMIGSGAFNNFNYTTDSDFSRCPFHAHIRKTNDRTEEAKKRIMARRGIPFGRRNVPVNIEQEFPQMPEGGVGLLFMSFQSCLSSQFEAIQNNANNSKPDNSDVLNHLDPIIGQESQNPNAVSDGRYPKVYGDGAPANLEIRPFHQFVHMKGGEYFFAPSIPFLKNIT